MLVDFVFAANKCDVGLQVQTDRSIYGTDALKNFMPFFSLHLISLVIKR